jgi:hypothetical protein
MLTTTGKLPSLFEHSFRGQRVATRDEIVDRLTAFLIEYRKESDRAAVIVGAAALDNLLHQILQAFLRPNTGARDELLDGDSPLGTFSARIMVSHCLDHRR